MSIKIREFVAQHQERLMAYAIILILALGIYLYKYQPVLLNDDWVEIRLGKMGAYPWFLADNRRPLMWIFWAFLASIFGVRVDMFYISGVAFLFLAALLIYEMVKKHVEKRFSYVALLIALIFTVYPVLAKQWLTLFGGGSVLVYLSNCFILDLYARKKNIYLLLLAIILLFVTLLWYESGLGLYIAWSILLFLREGRKNKAILFPFLALPVYALWSMTRADHYMSMLTDVSFLSRVFGIMKNTLISIYSSFLYWGYGIPFPKKLLLVDTFPVYISKGILLALLMIFIVIVVAFLAKLFPGKYSNDDKPAIFKLASLLLSSGGFLFICAFFPANLVFSAGFDDTLSTRFFFYSSIGASIFMVGTVILINYLLSVSVFRLRISLILTVILLSCLGILAQFQNRQDLNSAWNLQKQLWQQMFSLAPDLKNGTFVIVVMKNKESGNLNIFSQGEATDGTELLYDNQTLSGSVVTNVDSVNFSTDGYKIRPQYIMQEVNPVIPWKRIIMFEYDQQTGILQIVQRPTDVLNLDFIVDAYDPDSLIILDAKTFRFRDLLLGR